MVYHILLTQLAELII